MISISTELVSIQYIYRKREIVKSFNNDRQSFPSQTSYTEICTCINKYIAEVVHTKKIKKKNIAKLLLLFR